MLGSGFKSGMHSKDEQYPLYLIPFMLLAALLGPPSRSSFTASSPTVIKIYSKCIENRSGVNFLHSEVTKELLVISTEKVI